MYLTLEQVAADLPEDRYLMGRLDAGGNRTRRSGTQATVLSQRIVHFKVTKISVDQGLGAVHEFINPLLSILSTSACKSFPSCLSQAVTFSEAGASRHQNHFHQS